MGDFSPINQIDCAVYSGGPLSRKHSTKHVGPGAGDDVGSQALSPKRQHTVNRAQDRDHNNLLHSLVRVRKSEQHRLPEDCGRDATAQC